MLSLSAVQTVWLYIKRQAGLIENNGQHIKLHVYHLAIPDSFEKKDLQKQTTTNRKIESKIDFLAHNPSTLSCFLLCKPYPVKQKYTFNKINLIRTASIIDSYNELMIKIMCLQFFIV